MGLPPLRVRTQCRCVQRLVDPQVRGWSSTPAMATPICFANDAGRREGYLLAGAGDDKTDIVVYTEFYNRPQSSRDR